MASVGVQKAVVEEAAVALREGIWGMEAEVVNRAEATVVGESAEVSSEAPMAKAAAKPVVAGENEEKGA